MAKKVVVEKKFFGFLKRFPIGFYLSLIIVLLIPVVFFASIIIKKLLNAESEAVYAQLIVGLIASFLSFVLCINGIFSTIISIVNRRRDAKNKRNASVSSYIKDFNTNILEDMSFVNNVLKGVEKDVGFSEKFDSSFQNQAKTVEKLEAHLKTKNINYDEVLLYRTAIALYTSNRLNNNPNMTRYLENILNDKKNNPAKFGKHVTTIGGKEILNRFTLARIKVLNYFERMAIEFVNGNLSEELTEVQFSDILLKISSSYYYLIYKDEGLNCYPYLNVMLQIIKS